MDCYHGTKEWRGGYEGICLTDSEDSAARYGRSRRGSVVEIELDMSSLVAEQVDGYDHDANDVPCDSESVRREYREQGVDVLVYEDEDEDGQEHTCYRLISQRGIDSIRLLGITDTTEG